MRGISAIIAVILLLMISIAITGFAYFFFSSTVKTAANETSAQLEQTTSAFGENFVIESVSGYQVVIRNRGRNPLINTSISFYLNSKKIDVISDPASVNANAIGIFLLNDTQISSAGSSGTLKVSSLGASVESEAVFSCNAGSACNDGNGCTSGEIYSQSCQCAGGAPVTPCCGNAVCEGGENSNNCPADCAAPPVGYYTLTVIKIGTGSGTVTNISAGISCGSDCSESYADGTNVVLPASPDSGSVFSGWGMNCTGAGSCLLTMSQNRSVTANFTKICGNGTVDLGEECEPSIMPLMQCQNYNPPAYVSGSLSCNPPGDANECKYNVTACTPASIQLSIQTATSDKNKVNVSNNGNVGLNSFSFIVNGTPVEFAGATALPPGISGNFYLNDSKLAMLPDPAMLNVTAVNATYGSASVQQLTDFYGKYTVLRMHMDGNVIDDKGHSATNISTNCNVQGKFGHGCNFNGLNSYINVSDSAPSLNISKNITMEAWINTPSTTGLRGIFGKWREPSSSFNPRGYLIFLSGLTPTFYIGYGDLATASGGTTMTGQWNHISATYNRNAGIQRVYVNGIQDASNSYAGDIPVAQNNLYIGIYEWNSVLGGFFNGTIDEVRILNVTRTMNTSYVP